VKKKQISKSEAVRFRVMRVVQDDPHITQRELADRLGISLGKVNYCIKALVDKGLMKVENFRASETKWRYVYVLTPRGIAARAALTNQFLEWKVREFEELEAEIAALKYEIGTGKDPTPP
jgi:EPS-associated MarR family transcriptional regulator